MLTSTRNADETRLEGVMSAIRGRIANRTLTPGAKLPSIRSCARSMGVSKSTVVEAYDRLAAEGVIRSRPGAGFFVTAPLAPLALAEIGPALDREVDPLWISRQALASGSRMAMPGCGWLPASWMPVEAMRRALRRLSRADAAVLADYGEPLGSPSLRTLLARRMAGHGIEASPGQVMLTDSGTQAIDLLCRFLLKPGDTVLVDDPCYFNFHALLRAHQVKIVGVPYTPSGPDVARFAEALDRHSPRLYITNSALHNPTGAVLSPAVAHRLLLLAEKADLTIVEDDIFADFEVEPAPRLAAFDGFARVVYIGSFSKSLSASMRCGFVAAPRGWIDGLTDLRIATCFGGPSMAAELVLALLGDGSYRRHMETVRQRLSASRETVGHRLKMLGIEPWIEPRAGMFLWCRLPDGLDASAIARHALEHDVVLAPGNAFSLSGSARGFLRFNAAQCDDKRIFLVLEKVMRAL
ncbi:DNA-binding transcriptional regulator, MocR family, contains an aminotransferase domain [Nitratireductor aquibiodomus]|uniref:DNA-binding transcriptional regulator, MocR family, contains an aminotransferase domain n=2 Tax=Nitratireductor aquibiodomus TaxID=204799 RepID=A0A1H4JQN0_9HYPH|nr:PLP-dependent aminotransferase family protein [Nitratireductor aquibiodomus]SEB48437.1 DNA-binding transcriptional regulator, MocR family, contains an aminotransferase domain [Nitratireductor aquibiodomus]